MSRVVPDGRHRATFRVTGRIGDITCRIGWAQGQLCTWHSPRAGRGGEPQRVEVFENHPEILCKMATAWCLAVDCGLDRRWQPATLRQSARPAHFAVPRSRVLVVFSVAISTPWSANESLAQHRRLYRSVLAVEKAHAASAERIPHEKLV